MQQRREKNLCFNCDEKFIPGLRCKNAQSLLIELCDKDEEDDDCMARGEDAKEHLVSLHALVGESSGKTLCISGLLQQQQVFAMVNSGKLKFYKPVIGTMTASNSYAHQTFHGEGCEWREIGVPGRNMKLYY